MNTERRKAIEGVKSTLDQAKGDIENLQQEEQEYFDNMPESLQGGEKGEKAQAAADALQEAMDNIESAIDNLSTATEE